ncbi:MAG: hypothetical protein NTX03_08845 [Bacteroidetes bacterium]|nr:hypothetical protein [Bacteroidota bacterium]
MIDVKLKFSELNNLSDARYAAGVGAAFIGFNFNPESPRFIDPEKFKEIAGWLHGSEFIIEWDSTPFEDISTQMEELQLSWLQLNFYDVAAIKLLSDFNLIQNINLDSSHDPFKEIEDIADDVEYFLLRFEDSKNQETFLANPGSMQSLKNICQQHPCFLDFHFTEANLLSMIETIKPYGINLKGGNEIRPGYKDFDEMAGLVELLEG